METEVRPSVRPSLPPSLPPLPPPSFEYRFLNNPFPLTALVVGVVVVGAGTTARLYVTAYSYPFLPPSLLPFVAGYGASGGRGGGGGRSRTDFRLEVTELPERTSWQDLKVCLNKASLPPFLPPSLPPSLLLFFLWGVTDLPERGMWQDFKVCIPPSFPPSLPPPLPLLRTTSRLLVKCCTRT